MSSYVKPDCTWLSVVFRERKVKDGVGFVKEVPEGVVIDVYPFR